MNENKFWLGVWSLITLFIISIMITITIININYNNTILEMVVAGATPLEAVCSLSDSMGNNPTCIILSMEKLNND